MVQQKSLEAHQLKTYTTFLKFFQRTLGITQPLRDEIPHAEIQDELKFAKKKGFNEVGKGIIAKHVLLSFFPPQLRKNSLLLLYLYKKLFKGETPLKNRSIAALSKYVASIEPGLRDNVKKHSDLAEAMLNAINIMLPDEKVDFYFNNYLKRLIFWNETLLEDDYNILDAIIDDFWISNNWRYSTDEVKMILTISQLFNSHQKPFSLSFFRDYVEKNQEVLLGKFGSCKWIFDEKELSTLWKKFTNQGINFSYSINSEKLGLVPVNFVIQLHPKTDLQILRFSFEVIGNNYYMFENWSQNCLVIFGMKFVPYVDIDSISIYFERLKNIGTIKDYTLISGKGYYRDFSPFLLGIQEQENSKLNLLWEKGNNADIVKVDALDHLFLRSLKRIGFTGFPLDDVSKFIENIRYQIKSHISSLKNLLIQLGSIDSYLQMSTKILQIIIPKCYCDSEFETIGNYLQNSNLDTIDNLFFFEKWHQILSQINKLKSRNDIASFTSLQTKNPTLFIKFRNEMRTIKRFVVSSYKSLKNPSREKRAYSTKKLLNKLIKDENSVEILSTLVADLKSLIFVLKSNLKSMTYDLDNISLQISYLEIFQQLPDYKLLSEFQNRLQKYLDNNIIIPNLMHSVVLENLGYFNCSFFNEKIPLEARNVFSRKIRKNFFSIIGNILGNWDIDYGTAKPDKVKDHWLISQKFSIQNASFIQTPYDVLYHYNDLYDFSTQKFPSIKPMMRDVLKFCSKHLKNTLGGDKEQFTEYFKANEVSSKGMDLKSVNSFVKYLKSHIPKAQKETFVDVNNITRLFQEGQQKNTSVFLSPENTSMKEIQAEINWPRIGLEEYIVSFKVKKEKFSHKALPHPVNTREFLCVPCIKEMYCTSDTGYFQNTFIHYIFPFNSPPYNVFHSLVRWNYIENFQIMRIKSKKICFNDQFLDNNSTGFKAWELAAHRLITGNVKDYNVDPITFDYAPGQKILGPSSSQFNTIKTIFGKNIRQLKNIPIYDKIEKLFKSGILWYTPNMSQLYPLPLRLVIQLYPLSPEQLKLFKLLFIAAPVSIQYLVDIKENNTVYEGLFASLRFHKSNLSELLCALQNAVRYYKIKNFRVIPSIIPITKEEFVGYKLKNYPSLFESFIWDSNHFRNIRFLNQTGPLSFKERYKQL
ncbi:MAG: hypothetical protein ACTSRE_00030 [Promethearchaeota archaeon]